MAPRSVKQAHRSSAKRKPVKQSKSKPVKFSKRKPGPKPVVPAQTSPSVPIPKGSFEHVVIILKENHTFDCYFGTFPGVEGNSTLAHASDPPTGRFSNNHAAWLARATKAVREQYHQGDIASYWAYAQRFTLCDSFFTDVASDSTPNHLMLIAADSPVINNPSFGSSPSFDLPSLPANLQTAGLTWRNYGGYAFHYITQLKSNPWNVASQQFITDAAAGNLPSVSWVYPPNLQSEHPNDNVADGMQWTVDQVNAIVKGGLWNKTAVFISWDDWGGWHDHVTPPTSSSGAMELSSATARGCRAWCLLLM
ncbi:MAG TPA: alkaline phosphatase family protein [Chthoniobacterales bacterium]|nr:alkaline phosphatase family protein [Chthoniobacterales bacterium]